MRRMQASWELLVIVALMFILLMALMSVYFDKQQTALDLEETMQLRLMAFSLARNINAVVAAGNGSNATVTIYNIAHYYKYSDGSICFDFNADKRLVEVELEIGGVLTKAVAATIVTNDIDNTGFCLVSPSSSRTFRNVGGHITVGT